MEFLAPQIVRYVHSSLDDLLGAGYDQRVSAEQSLALREQLVGAVTRRSAYQACYRLDGQPVREFGFWSQQKLLGYLHLGERPEANFARFEYLREMLEPSIACLDRDYRYLSVNSAWCRTHGLTSQEVLGKTLAEVWGSEIFESTIKPLFEHAYQGGSLCHELGLRGSDGRDRVLEVNLNPLPEGKVVAVTREVTGTVEEQRRKLELERKLRTVFESPLMMSLLLTPEGLVYEVSPAAARVLTAPELDPRGQPLLELLEHRQGAEVKARFESALRQAAGGTTQTFEAVLSDLVLQVTFSPIFDDNRLRLYFVHCLDVTERNASRDSLRQSEQNLQDLFQATPSAMLVVLEGNLVRCNPAALNLLGATSQEQVVGRPLQAFFERVLTVASFETSLRRLSGEKLRVEVAVTPILLAGERHLLYDCYNLTAQKDIQKALQAAMEAAENANRAKSTFLATMSHEIRTPLNGIIGLLHLARQSSDRTRQLDYLEKLERAAQGLLRIINDVLDFSKIEAGQLHLEIDDFELESVLDQLQQMISVWCQEKPGLHYEFDVQPGLPRTLRGDSLRLTQVLMNLCSNAVKFTQQGQVKVEVVSRSQDDATVLLEFRVRDTGIGMTPQQIERTFIPFSQADSSTTRLYGGTGLGLFITKRYVELLGGTISVESVPDQGSCFTFTARFARPVSRKGGKQLDGLRVLVLDENDASRQNFQTVLTRLGCSYQLLKTAEQALYLSGDARFEAVVLDGRLEQVDEIFQCLKLHEGLKEALFLMLSRPESLAGAFRLGFDGVLSKPISDLSFCQAVEAARQRVSNNRLLIGGAVQFADAHVLLVEDNDINQEVAREILRLFGLRVTLAATGQEALDALEEENFDLVLMDLQMPEMDGLEATRRARGLGHRLPILAMTANARREDRELCLAAGMDDYLSKPINPEVLSQLLRRYLQPGEAATAEPLPEEADFPEVQGVHCQAGLRRLGGNRRLYRSLLLQFARRQQSVCARLEQAAGDELRALIHTIKGAAGNLGAEVLAAQCRGLEQGSSSVRQVRQELERVVEGILGLETVEFSNPSSGKILDQAKVTALLQRLRQLLDQDLGEAFVTLEEVVREMEGTALSPQAMQLKVWMEEFEVEQARALVDSLL